MHWNGFQYMWIIIDYHFRTYHQNWSLHEKTNVACIYLLMVFSIYDTTNLKQILERFWYILFRIWIRKVYKILTLQIYVLRHCVNTRLCSSCNRKLKWWGKLLNIKDDWISFAKDWESSFSVFSNCVILIEYMNLQDLYFRLLHLIWNLIIISYFKIVIVLNHITRSKDKDITIFTIEEMFTHI